ncbi:MAG: DUF4838 domain-containing protein [Lentisphaeria bacterium]|nr:DUF4838 domain-containing protein [Lentisphaeria bacterium]
MKKKLCFVALFACILSLPALDIVKNKKACARIVVNPAAGKLEKMALDDLKKYLEQAAKVRFQVVLENKAAKSGLHTIYLGSTKFAEKNGFPQSALKKEEWVIKTVGNDLIITGAPPAGTFYGVWALLNKLGIYALTAEQDAVPYLRRITLPKMNIRQKPVFQGRMIFTDIPIEQGRAKVSPEMVHKINMFTLRSGINNQEGPRITPYYIGQFFLSPKAIGTLVSHTLCVYVSPEKYFKTHPEYFAMNEEGKRFAPPPPYIREGSVCMSNKDVWKVTLDSLRKMIKEDRVGKTPDTWPIRYDISILDNVKYLCKCPECVKISKEEGSESGLYMRYINYVATEIAKEYPDILIKCSSYSVTSIPPKHTRPARNVLVQVSNSLGQSDAFRPLTHPINAHRLKAIKEWTGITQNFAFSCFWNIGRRYFSPPRLEVLVDAIKPNLQLVAEEKAMSVFIENEKDFIAPQPFYDLQVFLATHLMMDLDRDVEKLIDIYLKHYYGAKAAPLMRAYLTELREGVKTHPDRQTTIACGRWHFFNADFALRNYQRIKKAIGMYPPGNPCRDRLEQELITVMWCSLLSRREVGPTFKKAGIDMKKMQEECRILVDRYIRHWGGTDLTRIYKTFDDRWAAIEDNLPRPEKFKDVPDKDIRIAGTTFANPFPHMGSAIVADPESITGKAMRSYGPHEGFHSAKPVSIPRKNKPSLRMSPMRFSLSNSTGNKKKISMILNNLPTDEKYHWYKLPGTLELASRAWFTGHCWAIQFQMSSFYLLADGISKNNLWECWFSAKFTGPAYSPGSKKKNAVYIDMVVLTRPGTKGIKK